MIVTDAAAKIHITARQMGIHAEPLLDEHMQKSK
jgi:hypothetical protein